jgi:hypothetical protein
VEKGCIRSVMLTAVRSQCLLAKTFMMIYAASSFYSRALFKRHTAVYTRL